MHLARYTSSASSSQHTTSEQSTDHVNNFEPVNYCSTRTSSSISFELRRTYLLSSRPCSTSPRPHLRIYLGICLCDLVAHCWNILGQAWWVLYRMFNMFSLFASHSSPPTFASLSLLSRANCFLFPESTLRVCVCTSMSSEYVFVLINISLRGCVCEWGRETIVMVSRWLGGRHRVRWWWCLVGVYIIPEGDTEYILM